MNFTRMSNLLTKIFSTGAKELTNSIGNVIDNLSTSDDEKLKAKKEISEVALNALTRVSELQSEVLKTEMQGNWLQRSWRPILMLTFGALLVMKWLGITDTVAMEIELALMDIIQLGLGGYVVGRSAEKIATTVTANTDLTFLRKKDRKES